MESEGRVLAGKLVKDDNGAKLKELIIQTLTKKGFEVEDGDQLSVRGKMDEFSKNVEKLSKKYDCTLTRIEDEITSTEKDLASMIDELVGDEFDMKGLNELKSLLNGGNYGG